MHTQAPAASFSCSRSGLTPGAEARCLGDVHVRGVERRLAVLRHRPQLVSSGACCWTTRRSKSIFVSLLALSPTSAEGRTRTSAFRFILGETHHGPIHWRLPVRRRPSCGVGTPISGRPLSLSRLPQASWGPFSRLRCVPSGCGDDRRRNARLRRAAFLSPLRFVRFRAQRRRNRSESRMPGCPRPTDANLRKLDRPSRVLVAAVSTHEAIRPRSRRHGSL